MKVILYSTHCPKCSVLESKLKEKNIEFKEVNDQQIMLDKGFMSAPMLEVDGEILKYADAMKWVSEIG